MNVLVCQQARSQEWRSQPLRWACCSLLRIRHSRSTVAVVAARPPAAVAATQAEEVVLQAEEAAIRVVAARTPVEGVAEVEEVRTPAAGAAEAEAVHMPAAAVRTGVAAATSTEAILRLIPQTQLLIQACGRASFILDRSPQVRQYPELPGRQAQ